MREVEDFNRGWRFRMAGEVSSSDITCGNKPLIANETYPWQKANNHGLSRPDNPGPDTWREVELPHDFVIEGEFTSAASLDNGSLAGGSAWYVRKFELPEQDRGRRIFLEFDGIYRDSTVHVNGMFMARNLSGYTSFGIEIGDICNFGGMNAVSVHVDATENELWSYDGGGIYRAVRLVKTAPVCVPRCGVHVATGGAEHPGRADMRVRVHNGAYERTDCEVFAHIMDPGGREVAASGPAHLSLDAMASAEAELSAEVRAPVLWSPDQPALYEVAVEIFVGGRCVDCYSQGFGFRYFRFDPDTGFWLNGVNLKLKGLCCHQDHAGVGVAVPPSLQAWRVRRLKDLGANAIRTSHNPPDPALLDACDRLGMLVMDELRLPGISDEVLSQFEGLVRRDRNHPSVILWSLGNEEMRLHATEQGVAMFRRLQRLSHQLDPGRPTTYAMNADWLNIIRFHDERGFRFDVFGANYRGSPDGGAYDEFHARFPGWPMLGSETWGGTCTRGLYEPEKSAIPVAVSPMWKENKECWRDEKHKHFSSAYGNAVTPWGCTLEEAWRDCANRPFMAGTFLWTGFDYRGEPFPYEWPAVVSRFGVLDLCGFYKEAAHYLRAWWRPDVPHLFIMPHWNWEGREGEPIDVWCYGNTAEVELFLNGRSLGRKAMPVNHRLEWQAPWEPGLLEAKGFDKKGREILSVSRRTAGAPAAIVLDSDADSENIRLDDVIVINAAIVDRNGEICPRADNTVEFSVSGPGVIIGAGNGNPISHEPDKPVVRRAMYAGSIPAADRRGSSHARMAYHGLCQVLVKAAGGPGILRLKATSHLLKEAEWPAGRGAGT